MLYSSAGGTREITTTNSRDETSSVGEPYVGTTEESKSQASPSKEVTLTTSGGGNIMKDYQ